MGSFAISQTRLSHILSRGSNNFDLIRLTAALAVVFGHAFYLHPPNGHAEPLLHYTGVDYAGSLAVNVFFFISGMLITRSFDQSQSPARYAIQRIGRIWPGLVVCVLLTVLLAGPLVSALPFNVYIRSPDTARYALVNAALYQTEFQLPGVFANNYLKLSVNGCLWTIPVEARCYLFVLAAGMMGCLSTRRSLLYTCMALVFSYYCIGDKLEYFADPLKARTCAFFLFGAFCYASRDCIPIDFKLLAALALLWIVCRYTAYNALAFYLLLTYAVLWLAANKVVCKLALPGDFSYGVYLYGFLIQQLVNLYFPLASSYRSLLLTLPASLAMGVLSWYLIEKRGLEFARRLAARFPARAAPAATRT